MSPSAAARATTAPRTALVAIAGNPNTGKTTLFNRLTGSDHRVGNYPGVTVERHSGIIALPGGARIELVDVPGSYSLSARSREEEIAIQAIAGLPPHEPPDVVVLVVDATQLSRNLYLALQVIELDVPVVLALNMTDALAARGESLDVRAIERELGVPAVPISALKAQGLDDLARAIERVLATPEVARPGARWKPASPNLRGDLDAVARAIPAEWARGSDARRRALAAWALLSLDDDDELADVPAELRALVTSRRAAAAAEHRNLDAEIVRGRYGWIDDRMARFLAVEESAKTRASERIDAVLLNPFAGFAIFLVLMAAVFQALFAWSDPVMSLIEAGFNAVADVVRANVESGLVRDFVTDGLIAGVGSVVVFLPQILLLFLFLGILEDTGYMSRVAFLMDRIMRVLGLNGRAFVPMLSGFACAVPAILATRTMERQRDRTLTMMVVPLMTCSARLPVYTLIIGALFPASLALGFVPVQGLLMAAMYLFATVTALIVAAVLSRTIFRGPRVPLILEMPPYRPPHWPSVLRMMWLRARAFLVGAGSVILACSVVLWFLTTFPRSDAVAAQRAAAEREVATASLDADEARERGAEITARYDGEQLRQSYAGRLGHALEPLIEPLGFDWKIGVGLVGAFAAREVFVSTLGVVYGAGGDSDEESTTLRDKIRAEARADGRPVYTPLVGLSLMVFFALAAQCMSTLAAVYREMRSWRWPLFLFVYMTALAWAASFVVYQGGRLLGFE